MIKHLPPIICTAMACALVGSLACLVTTSNALAAGMHITTDWHEEPVNDPDNQLIAGPIAAAVRTSDHIYELHFMCGRDQYGGPDATVRQPGTVLELAISAFNSNQTPAAIRTRRATSDEPASADVTWGLGSGHTVTQAFRSEGYPNVVSQAWSAESPMVSDNARSRTPVANVGQALAAAVAANERLTVANVLGHEQISLSLSSANPVLARFVAACPVTR